MRHASCALLIGVAASACGGDGGGGFNLLVEGRGFDDGEVHGAVVRLTTGENIGCEDDVVSGGAFSLAFAGALAAEVPHRVDVFVDYDGDQRCQFGIDAVMSEELEPAGDDVGMTFDAAQAGDFVNDEPQGCLSFDGVSFELTITGVTTSFVRWAFIRLNADGTNFDRAISTGEAFAENQVVVIDLPGAGLPGRFYRIDFFTADTFDAVCDLNGTVLRYDFGASGEDAPFQCGLGGGGISGQGELATDFDVGDCDGFAGGV